MKKFTSRNLKFWKSELLISVMLPRIRWDLGSHFFISSLNRHFCSRLRLPVGLAETHFQSVDMRAKELARFVTYSCLGSFAFLCLANVATMMKCCGNGHEWSLHEPASGGMPYMWCTHAISDARYERVSKVWEGQETALTLFREVQLDRRVSMGIKNC